MDRGLDENRKISRRYRRAAERLWESSSLRDELNDDQAKKMLDWGSTYLKEVANDTADLPDEEANHILETQTEQVSSVMRQVNALIKAVRTDKRQEALTQYMDLSRKLDELQNFPNDTSTTIEKMLVSSGEPSNQMIDQLMTLFDKEEE